MSANCAAPPAWRRFLRRAARCELFRLILYCRTSYHRRSRRVVVREGLDDSDSRGKQRYPTHGGACAAQLQPDDLNLLQV